jgi:CO/xanthine dehydrogenase Mo-binding subunit
MKYSDGQVVNASLADYKIPGLLDLPRELATSVVEVPHDDGPFGAKGVGETGIFSPAPAIANALYDAVGIVVTELPLTPERVLRAIREADGRPLDRD